MDRFISWLKNLLKHVRWCTGSEPCKLHQNFTSQQQNSYLSLQKSNFFFFFFNLQGDLGIGGEKRWHIKTHTGVEAACIWVRRSCSWSFISCIWLVLWCKPAWSNFTCIVKSKVPIGSLILMSISPYNLAHMDWIHGKDCSFDSFIEGFSFRRWMISRNMYKISKHAHV
jgi:hypothetical protein